MSHANVRAISVLTEQRAALVSFAHTTQATLDRAEMQLRQTEQHLEERRRYWTLDVARRTEEVARAQSALSDCMRSGSEDGPPNCRAYYEAVKIAEQALQYAQEKLSNVADAQKYLDGPASEYRSEAQRLRSLLHGEVPRGVAFLAQKQGELEAYLATNLMAGAAGAILGGIGFAAAAIGEIVRGAGAAPSAPTVEHEEAIAVTDMASLEARVAQQEGWTAGDEQADWDALAVQHAEHEHAATVAPTPAAPITTPPNDPPGHVRGPYGVEREPRPETLTEGGLKEQGG